MRLVPTQAPGRGTRKARDFGSEIVALRAQGYTLDAIRVALADAGVHVTISTVWREAKRTAVALHHQPAAKPTTAHAHPLNADARVTAGASPCSTAERTRPSRRKGMEVAEAFMRSQIDNALFRSKEPR